MEKIGMKVGHSWATAGGAARGLPSARVTNASSLVSASSGDVASQADGGNALVDEFELMGLEADEGPSDETSTGRPAPDELPVSDSEEHRQDDVPAGSSDVRDPSIEEAQVQGFQASGSFIETAGNSSATGERRSGWDGDLSSTDRFTIDHPRWGLIEVDSRRSPVSWDLTVRCADPDTRQRLKDNEQDFHALLRRDYGASLALDVQSVTST